MRSLLSLLACFLMFCFCGIGFSSLSLSAQTLEITPKRILIDESPVIRASGLRPGEHVTIRADLADGRQQAWSSEAEFVADAQGTVDVSKQAPLAGSYKEVSAAGLIWSMMPKSHDIPGYQPPQKSDPQVIHFHLLRNGEPAARADLEELTVADGVRQITVQGQIHGVLYLPAGNERHPGVLVVGGSEGGVPHQKAAWLASHGYAALALAYFRYEDLPPKLEAIPLEYFGKAISWMMQRPDVLSEKIAVVGTSRGAELALQLGSIYPQIKTVVAYVPANMRYAACCGDNKVPYAWTLSGQPLPFASPRGADPRARQNASIQVEHTHGPICLISGEEDGVWPSTLMAEAVLVRLKLQNFAYPVEHLKYAHAGHRAGRPEIVPSWHGTFTHPLSGREVNVGGTPMGDARSSLDATPKVLDFLRRSLQ